MSVSQSASRVRTRARRVGAVTARQGQDCPTITVLPEQEEPPDDGGTGNGDTGDGGTGDGGTGGGGTGGGGTGNGGTGDGGTGDGGTGGGGTGNGGVVGNLDDRTVGMLIAALAVGLLAGAT